MVNDDSFAKLMFGLMGVLLVAMVGYILWVLGDTVWIHYV